MKLSDKQAIILLTVLHDVLKSDIHIANKGNSYVVHLSYDKDELGKLYDTIIEQQEKEI